MNGWSMSAYGDVLSSCGRWRVRKDGRGPRYHLFFRGRRYTTTGRDEDIVVFHTVLTACMFAEAKGANNVQLGV